MSEPTPPETPDPALLRAEQRLRVLQGLTAFSMDIAGALHRRVLAEAEAPVAAAAPAARGPDPIEAFVRVSRVIRLTVTLEGKVDEALRALQAGADARADARAEARRAETARKAAAEAAAEVESRREAHTYRVRELVLDVAEREFEDFDALMDLEFALDERLEDDGAYADLENLPLRETVERLCHDLQLTPDWSLWTGEGWPPKPPFYRLKASPYCRPGQRPKCPIGDSVATILARHDNGEDRDRDPDPLE